MPLSASPSTDNDNAANKKSQCSRNSFKMNIGKCPDNSLKNKMGSKPELTVYTENEPSQCTAILDFLGVNS